MDKCCAIGGLFAEIEPLRQQEDLFSSPGALAIDPTFASARRTALDATSWVELVPGWMSGPECLFDELATAVPWSQHYRTVFEQRFLEPRLTAEYRSLSHVPHDMLVTAAAALSRHYGVEYDSVWLNLYRNGDDSTGWHRDRFSCRRPECIVPVLTLGATRRFQLKPRAGGASLSFSPHSGDLIVMGGRCQQDWVHQVPKLPDVPDPRISVNFQSAMQAGRQRNLAER